MFVVLCQCFRVICYIAIDNHQFIPSGFLQNKCHKVVVVHLFCDFKFSLFFKKSLGNWKECRPDRHFWVCSSSTCWLCALGYGSYYVSLGHYLKIGLTLLTLEDHREDYINYLVKCYNLGT